MFFTTPLHHTAQVFYFIFMKLMFFILFIAVTTVDSICFNSCRHGMVLELLSLEWSALATSERPCSIVGSHRQSVALIYHHFKFLQINVVLVNFFILPFIYFLSTACFRFLRAFLLVCLVKFVIQNGCVYSFVVLVRCILFFGQLSCIVLYKWAALLYTSGLHCCRQVGCIAVDKWTPLMQTSGLY